MVRNYLAYYGEKENGEIVQGESRFSLAINIRSEGMPIGAELRKIYYDFAMGMGATEKEVTDDLERVNWYLASARTQWLQTIRVSERGYMTPWAATGFYK